MIFLLDTNICIYAFKNQPTCVFHKLQSMSPDDLAISSVTIAEIWFGLEKQSASKEKRDAWSFFFHPYTIFSFDQEAALIHARLRHSLAQQSIGERALIIASIALANRLTLVTHNQKEFQRVPHLPVEDWTSSIS